MDGVDPTELDAFVATCREAGCRNLVRCSSGNLSRRLEGDRMLATASRSWLERLTPAEVCVCRLADGALLSGPRPTVEMGVHAEILRTRPEVEVVLHFQSPCATALACRADAVDYRVIPEVPYYLGPVARVPYLPPGSDELAVAVAAAMAEHDLVVLDHHGMVTVAGGYDAAIQNAEFFELACEVIVHGGEGVVPLAPEAVQALMAARRAADGKV